MSAITAWQRLELSARTEDIEPGLQARVADPLWFLARQWQFGEFQGEDAGSPVAARAIGQSHALRYWRPGPLPADGNGREGAMPLPDLPLEALVECEAVTSGPAATRFAAEAGLQFMRLLWAQGAGSMSEVFAAKFALAAPSGPGDAAAARYFDVLAGRAIDGRALRAAIPNPLAIPPQVTIAVASQAAVLQAIKLYAAWYDSRLLEPSGGSAWIPERMEYAFSVAAGAAATEVVLEASEYTGGQLDWTSFAVRPKAMLAPAGPAVPPGAFDTTVLPTSVTFHGAPRSRWWEIEDEGIDLGALEAGPADIARLVLSEFALLHSDDWFMLPIELPAGALARITTLTVTDTFGVSTVIRPANGVDGAFDKWRAFTLTGDPALTSQTAPWLLIAPALGRGLEGEAIEELALLRDEMADLAWGVERIVEGSDGRPLNRFEAWLQKRRAAATPPATGTRTPRYRLAPEVPEHWIPLVPVRTGQQVVGLRRGRVLTDPQTVPPAAQGRLLEPGRKLIVREEEVPSEGVRVTRAWQWTRGADGSTVVWVGRRKVPGRTERAPGLKFDAIEP